MARQEVHREPHSHLSISQIEERLEHIGQASIDLLTTIKNKIFSLLNATKITLEIPGELLRFSKNTPQKVKAILCAQKITEEVLAAAQQLIDDLQETKNVDAFIAGYAQLFEHNNDSNRSHLFHTLRANFTSLPKDSREPIWRMIIDASMYEKLGHNKGDFLLKEVRLSRNGTPLFTPLSDE